MKQLITKILSFLIVILLSFYAVADVVEDKYPPYPEIWGYDLSNYQALQVNDADTMAFKAENGDYWFRFREHAERNASRELINAKYGILKFFDNDIQLMSKAEDKNFINTTPRDTWISDYDASKITFSNGHTLSKESEFIGQICSHNLSTSYFIKRDENGKKIDKFLILVSSPNVQEFEDTSEHSIDLCGMPSVNDKLYEQLDFFSGGMVLLKDDTFILYGDHNVIVRFDQDLNTKFKSEVNYKTIDGRILKKNLFIIPYKVVKKIVRDVAIKNLPITQGIHDGLLDYIIKNQHKDGVKL